MCRINNSNMLTQGQGHSSRSWVWALNFVSALYFFYLGAFSLNFGQMFTYGTMCRTLTQPWGLKDKVTVQGREFVSNLYLLYPWKDFLLILVRWGMSCPVKWCAEPIAQPCRLTRSQFKVTDLSLEFCVRSVSPLPLGGFSLNFGQMCTSLGQSAEPITQPCGLKVKVTVEGHEWALNLVSAPDLLYPWKDFL